jgi:inhibitor of KinA
MENKKFPRILPVGDSACVVEFGDRIDPEINRRVHTLADSISKASIQGFEGITPAYSSLFVRYDALILTFQNVYDHIVAWMDVGENILNPSVLIEIPTVYGGIYGPDLAELARMHQMTVDKVIEAHSQVEYRVYMIGFTPGFPYLGEVDESIATPRLKEPRTFIPAGSVGIAGRQTGIYPIDSPGGWQIIGFTPLKLFDPSRERPSLLSPGDRVRFISISEEEIHDPRNH